MIDRLRFPAPSLTLAMVPVLAAALTLPGAPLVAQDAPAPAAPAEATTPAVGEPYLAATHRDWQVLCTQVGEGEAATELCEMYQLLTEESGQPVAEITIAALAETGDVVAGATVTTPLETFLPTGMGFRIGRETEEMRVEPFRVCTVVGCVVRMGLTAAEIQQLQRGAEAFVTIAPFVAIDQPLDLRVSLLGFTAALADVRERTPDAPEVMIEMPQGAQPGTAPAARPAVPPAGVIDPSTPPATPPAAQD